MKVRTACAACLVVALAAPGTSHAQSSEAVEADALFNTAMRLVEARVYEDACPKFAESKRLAPGIGVTLHLADCYERLGRKASAVQEFRAAEKLALERKDKRAELAAAHASALEPQLNRLTIPLPPPAGEGATGPGVVLLDGQPVSVEDFGKPLPVDPGDHTVTLNFPGQPPRTIGVHVEVGALLTAVTLDPPAAAAPPPPPPTPAPEAPSAPPLVSLSTGNPETPVDGPPHTLHHWIGGELMAAGLGGLIVGAILIPYNRAPMGAMCDPPAKKLSNWVPSIISFSLGTVALGAGFIVYRSDDKKTGVAVAATPFPGGGGAVVQAGF